MGVNLDSVLLIQAKMRVNLVIRPDLGAAIPQLIWENVPETMMIN